VKDAKSNQIKTLAAEVGLTMRSARVDDDDEEEVSREIASLCRPQLYYRNPAYGESFLVVGDMLLSAAQSKAAADVGEGQLLSRAAYNAINKWEDGTVPYTFERSYGRMVVLIISLLSFDQRATQRSSWPS